VTDFTWFVPGCITTARVYVSVYSYRVAQIKRHQHSFEVNANIELNDF